MHPLIQDGAREQHRDDRVERGEDRDDADETLRRRRGEEHVAACVEDADRRENGQIGSINDYKDGVKHGREASWDEKGKLHYDCVFENGQIVEKPTLPE